MTTFAQRLTGQNEGPNNQSSGTLPSIEYDLIRAHVFASLVTLVISVLFGIAVATKFSFPEFLGGHGWLTWGRLRYNHTQGIFFGWLGNSFLAFFYYVVPRLANRPVLSPMKFKVPVALSGHRRVTSPTGMPPPSTTS